MSVWRDMALDAGYRGAEADAMAAQIEQEEMARQAQRQVCDFDGHEWGDAGGGLVVCMRCGVEDWSDASRDHQQEDR